MGLWLQQDPIAPNSKPPTRDGTLLRAEVSAATGPHHSHSTKLTLNGGPLRAVRAAAKPHRTKLKTTDL